MISPRVPWHVTIFFPIYTLHSGDLLPRSEYISLWSTCRYLKSASLSRLMTMCNRSFKNGGHGLQKGGKLQNSCSFSRQNPSALKRHIKTTNLGYGGFSNRRSKQLHFPVPCNKNSTSHSQSSWPIRKPPLPKSSATLAFSPLSF